MLLFMGLLLGCLQAYYWLSLERRIIEREKRDEDCD
jgi:hypothetical protein